MRLFDLHADTPYRMYNEDLDFSSPLLHISAPYLANIQSLTQVFAVFSNKYKSDQQVYADFFAICNNFRQKISLCDFSSDFHYVLSVEDARLLCGEEERLVSLYRAGVRIMTPLWQGSTHIGGAFDTEQGLTPFGKKAVRYACQLGIIPDVSHASLKSTEQILDIATEFSFPCLATHSNAYGVTDHPRNLHDEHFLAVGKSGGLVGISLAPSHLSNTHVPTVDDIIRHIDYYLSLGGENFIALGCDFDGVESLPEGIHHVSDLFHLKNALCRLYCDEIADKLFFKNATSFFKRQQLIL